MTFAPFRRPIFRRMWFATLVSNFGSLLQIVGAAWSMTLLAPTPTMIALVQAASALPIMLFAAIAGAVADLHDRRRVMLAAQLGMFVASALLTALTLAGQLTPWSLLALTFLIGTGTAFHNPAWQASVREQVPLAEVPAAVSANIVGNNIARSVGPALGGIVVGIGGAWLAFVLNTLSYIPLVAILSLSRPATPPRSAPRARLGTTIRAGFGHVVHDPHMRVTLVRGFTFGVAASVTMALLPVVARDTLHGGAFVYGLLFGAFGAGAIVGALLVTGLRRRFTGQRIVGGAIVASAAATLLLATTAWLSLAIAALLVSGGSWASPPSMSASTCARHMASPAGCWLSTRCRHSAAWRSAA